jgi:methylated-DNA-[protein]-cysteine S-methyltransferase
VIERMNKIEPSPIWFIVRPSPFGPFAVLWADHGRHPWICRVLLPKPHLPAAQAVRETFPGIKLSTCGEITKVADQIEAFLHGEDIRFSLATARLDLCSTFQEQVLRAEHGIPRGLVSTYQRIAAHLGRPSSARAVGMALAHNPFPIIIPCHRVIRADGALGGYQGGLAMKRKLLEMENITIDDSGYVTAARYFY